MSDSLQLCSTPGFSVHGIFFSGKNTGVRCHSFLPGHLPNPGIEAASPALAGRFFTTEMSTSTSSQTGHLDFKAILQYIVHTCVLTIHVFKNTEQWASWDSGRWYKDFCHDKLMALGSALLAWPHSPCLPCCPWPPHHAWPPRGHPSLPQGVGHPVRPQDSYHAEALQGCLVLPLLGEFFLLRTF